MKSKPFFSPRTWIVALVLLLLARSILFAAEQQLYTCGMHPQIIKTEPGDCPICGMKLQPIRASVANVTTAAPAGERKIKYYKSTMIAGEVSEKPGKDTMGMDLEPVYEDAATAGAAITVDAVTIQKMNLRTGLVTRGPVRRQIRTVGVVEFNERGLHDITTKYEGWIEKLYVNATWTAVKAGDPLFEIYSPELYNAELNYLVALKAEGGGGGPLSQPALERLKLFDVTPAFLAELARTGEARRTYTFTAPSDGVVIEKMAVVGQMMKPGERVFRLADLSTVWLNAQIYEDDLAAVAPGRPVEVSATHGNQHGHGTIEQILPQVQAETRTAVARIVLDNADGAWRPGMFADVRLATELAPSAVLVPDSAVLRSGERNTVFVALPGGQFAPREVKLGARTDDYRYEVLSGLAEGDRVVVSGQFMLDSESQLREAIQKMLKSEAAPVR